MLNKKHQRLIMYKLSKKHVEDYVKIQLCITFNGLKFWCCKQSECFMN